MVVSLSMTKESFTKDKQMIFRESIARTAGVEAADVTIDKIEVINGRRDTTRRLLAESVRVEFKVKAVGESEADSMAQRLTSDKINAQLEKGGIGKANILEAPKTVSVVDVTSTDAAPTDSESKASAQQVSESTSKAFPFIWVGIAVAGGCVICVLFAAKVLFARKSAASTSSTLNSTSNSKHQHARADSVFICMPSEPHNTLTINANTSCDHNPPDIPVEVTRLAPKESLNRFPEIKDEIIEEVTVVPERSEKNQEISV